MKRDEAVVGSGWVWTMLALAVIYAGLHAGMFYRSLQLLATLCSVLMGNVK